MSREEFLSSCCRDKAGLPADAWKDPETEIMVFTTESFGED
jgi:AMMECR1 domain-containing protein